MNNVGLPGNVNNLPRTVKLIYDEAFITRISSQVLPVQRSVACYKLDGASCYDVLV